MATGALNPANGIVAAALSTPTFDTAAAHTPPPANDPVFDGVEVLTEQILSAVARSRALGHRDTRITLTRPTETVEGVRNRLLMAGLAPVVRASSTGGVSVLSVRC
ncbi:hypothetical protein CHU95_13935 [Niveispirillum lacus]|uniref:Uncharacterized protein n=1 Tax=Niveispirillum lacus TaxID=1981099 RepID=A0A255YXS2_9PROT|nr:hypothetical protein CHU95_13935 [Niveispirillum lacus]